MRTLILSACLLCAAGASAQQAQRPFEPIVGMPGKDVVWVPTSPDLVDLMLKVANVTKDDIVMDLGSGDGRNIIAAATLGARAVGVEFNPAMVALANRLAAEAGVADRASFVQGDMYEADISKATVLALPMAQARMRGPEIQFIAGGQTYTGTVNGDRIDGLVTTPSGQTPWSATRTAR